MTSDRLRQAADRLERYQAAISENAAITLVNGRQATSVERALLVSQGRRSKRTAVLLRAIARWPHDEFGGNCLLECRAAAALDLADQVLGGSQ